MTFSRATGLIAAALILSTAAACGRNGSEDAATNAPSLQAGEERETIWDLFNQYDDGTKVGVNRYLWNASLDVLNFLPVQSIDPFTGVIVFGTGTPPGGGRSYRGTVYISDAALEARSLKLSLMMQNGQPVAAETQRAVEDAILTRARQMRVADRRY